MKRFIDKLRKKKTNMSESFDKYQETLSFAEANQHELISWPQEVKPIEEKQYKLLVVASDNSFSSEMVDYALDMAKRMSYEILALSTAPLSNKTIKLFASSQNQLCDEFKEMAQENIIKFKTMAQEMGLEFSHEIKFRDTDQAIEEVVREHGNIDFVVAEHEKDRSVIKADNRPRTQKEMVVYSMA